MKRQVTQDIVKEHLPEWIFDKKLGKGGQGTVIRLIDKETKTRYSVLKVLNHDKPKSRNRFHIERIALETLKEFNLNIPRVISSNSDQYYSDKPLYLQTEYIAGKTLQETINASGPLPLDRSISLVLDLLEIIKTVHEHRIVHRDIKPANIIMDHNDQLYLVDFGLSYTNMEDQDLTLPTDDLGSRFLSLPELRLSTDSPEDKRDERTDVSLCFGVLYYVLTGSNPIEVQDLDGNRPHERKVFRKIVSQEEQVKFSYLSTLFDLAFQYNLLNRIQSANEAISELKKVQEMRSIIDLEIFAREANKMLFQNNINIKKASVSQKLDLTLRRFFGEHCKKISSKINPFKLEMGTHIIQDWPCQTELVLVRCYHLSFHHLDDRDHFYLARYCLMLEGDICLLCRDTGIRTMEQLISKFSNLFDIDFHKVVKFNLLKDIPLEILKGDLTQVTINAISALSEEISKSD